MRKKNPVTFSQKFSKADPLAVRLLQRLLAFDPKDRPTAAEALADPYFKGLSKVEREPSCQPISKMEFEFERRRLTKEDIRELIYREILEYHPQLLKDHMSGSEGSNFVYPSAIGHLRKQFTYLEENSSRNGPVIPLERKHASLPRSTVHSSVVHSTIQPNLCATESRRVPTGLPSTSAFPAKSLGPPPRVPSGRPGRVVESSSASYENGRNLKEAYFRSAVSSPHCYFRSNTNVDASSQPKPQEFVHQFNPTVPPAATATTNQTNVKIINHPNPYFQSQLPKIDQLSNSNNTHMAIDATLMQAQSQFGPAGAAAVAVAAHRNIGTTISYGAAS
uniref:Mitogen-activated protein kinase 18 n=1 Tax=Noccaea caerulescens TaxID=107243 RepID=A0A1J3J2H5_NOCCA